MEGTLEELRRISNCPEGATFSQLGLRKSVDPSYIRSGVGRCGLLPLPFPDEVFPLCILQHLGQLGIAAVVGQDEDYLRIRFGIGVRDRSSAVNLSRQCALVFSQKIWAVTLP